MVKLGGISFLDKFHLPFYLLMFNFYKTLTEKCLPAHFIGLDKFHQPTAAITLLYPHPSTIGHGRADYMQLLIYKRKTK